MVKRLCSVGVDPGAKRLPARQAFDGVPWVPASRGRSARTVLVAAAVAAIGTVALGFGASPALAADSCPNAQFRTGPSAHLSDCRAFEQVSPVNKRGNGVATPPAKAPPGWASADGDTILFNPALGPGTDNAVRGQPFPQVAERTADGWANRPAANGPAPQAVIDTASAQMFYQVPDASRKSLLFSSGAPFTVDNPLIVVRGNGSVNLARGSAVDWLSKPTWANASPAPGSAELANKWMLPAGGSDDLSTSYFMTQATLTPEDGASGRAPLTNWALYRWKDGHLANAGVLPPTAEHPAGTVDPGGSVLAGLAPPGGTGGVGSASTNQMVAQQSYTHSISADGTGVLFVSPDPKEGLAQPSQLYLAREGKPTVLLSKHTGATAAPSGSAGVMAVGGINGSQTQTEVNENPGVYAVASRDQQVVLFSTTDVLTDGDDVPDASVVKTYRYTVADGALAYLPDLDRPSGTSPKTTVGLVFNMSDDGSRILYRTSGSQLRLWRDGQSTITLSDGVGRTETVNQGITESRFSKDGRTLVLMSRVPLAGESDHPLGGSVAQTQVYRYAEDDGHLDCVSCPPQAASPRGPSAFTLQGLDNGFGSSANSLALEPTRGMTADGKIVFFTTTSPLSTDDHNAVADVYEWRDGDADSPRLVSSGAASSMGDYLIDNSSTGSDVFFVSQEALVGADTDDLYDMYDARVGGGFAPPVKEVVPCEEDACQGTVPREKAPFTAAGSLTFAGGGNIAPPAEEPAKIRVSKVKTVRGTSTRVKVKVPGKGKIRTSGSGLRRGHKTAKKAGTYRVTVKLSKRARRTLKRKHRVKVRVSVRFAPAKGKAQRTRVSVTFKPKARKKKHSSSRSVGRATVLTSGSGKGR